MIVDSYSGWYEIDTLPDPLSKSVIDKLKRQFATHGIPSKLVSDNVRQFTSREFQDFATQWDFRHITSSLLYGQSNGLADHAVKSGMRLLEHTKELELTSLSLS